MSTDHTNLEEMVEKTLESTGVLPKMKAELRASVFQILEKGASFQNKLYTDKIKEFLSNKNGSLLLSLVKELFDYLELKFTNSVFDPETGAGLQYQYKDKDDMVEELSLSKDDKRPLLMQILEIHESNNDTVKKYSTQYNGSSKIYPESQFDQLLKTNANAESVNTIFDSKSKSFSLTKTVVFEEKKMQLDNHTNSAGSLSSSNFNLSDNNILIKDTESSESSNSVSIEKLSPTKRKSIEQNDNTDDDVKSDLKSNKNDSSLDDIDTEENVSCGNDSLPSIDLSTQNGSPEIIKTKNIYL